MSDQTIIDLLQKIYAAELETVANYIANSIWLDGFRAEEIKESLAADVTEELGHAQKLAQRIKVLGAAPHGSLQLARTQQTLQPPADSTDIASVVKGVIDAETAAINGYKELIKACEGRDYVTQDLAITLLADEEEHLCLFQGFQRSLDGSGR